MTSHGSQADLAGEARSSGEKHPETLLSGLAGKLNSQEHSDVVFSCGEFAGRSIERCYVLDRSFSHRYSPGRRGPSLCRVEARLGSSLTRFEWEILTLLYEVKDFGPEAVRRMFGVHFFK